MTKFKTDPFDCYQLYLALKLHFKPDSNYDFFQFRGKTSASAKTLRGRNDRFFFEKLAHDYRRDDLIGLFVSNLLFDRDMWIRDFLTREATQRFKNRESRMIALTKIVADDLTYLCREHGFIEAFKAAPYQHPPVMQELMRHDIQLESFVIFNNLFGLSTIYDRVLQDDAMWRNTKSLVVKYAPFVEYDHSRVEKELETVLDIEEEPMST